MGLHRRRLWIVAGWLPWIAGLLLVFWVIEVVIDPKMLGHSLPRQIKQHRFVLDVSFCPMMEFHVVDVMVNGHDCIGRRG